jgi:two-component system cell cycle sensor histidine kinase/response regulator CckA
MVGVSSVGHRIEVGPEDFRALVEQAATGIFISTEQGQYVAVNPSGHRLLGYEPGELVGRQIAEVLPASEQSQLVQALEQVRRGEVQIREWTFLRKDGTCVQAEVTAQRLSTGFLMAIVRDLDQRTFARQISESEARLRSILETAPDVIMTVDRAGTILFINRTTPPYTREQVIGTCCFDYVPDDSRARVEAALDGVFSKREIAEYEVQGPPGPTGERGWSSVRAGPLIADDRVFAATLCATDVTRRKEVDAAKARLEDQLRQSQKLQSLGQLAGGVAHDFNNLLTSILGYVELAKSELPDDGDAAEFLDGAIAAVKRGAALSQQMLAFARKKIVHPEVVALNDVLQSMTGMIRRLMGENLEVVLALSPDLGVVRVDVGSLEQVIMNLVLNARDAIPGAGRITLHTENVLLDADAYRGQADVAPGKYVMLAVSDTGRGMTPEISARIFEPFFTTKPVGEGTGLGLAMCDGIVRQAGGTIAVASEPGKGSSFRVYFPRTRDGEPSAPTKPRPTSVGGRETLLVVEDELMILSVAKRALTALGYDVLTAANGAQALELAASTARPIHLLVTDVVMPKMGGRELAEQLAALRPGVRVLYTSGYTSNAIGQHCVLEEGINFLQKPYSATTLATRIREVLDRVP